MFTVRCSRRINTRIMNKFLIYWHQFILSLAIIYWQTGNSCGPIWLSDWAWHVFLQLIWLFLPHHVILKHTYVYYVWIDLVHSSLTISCLRSSTHSIWFPHEWSLLTWIVDSSCKDIMLVTLVLMDDWDFSSRFFVRYTFLHILGHTILH